VSKLPRSFYARAAEDVARDLLGKVLVRMFEGHMLRGRIVETESYTGESDPGSHAFRGPSPRNRVMFGEAGHLYVYLSYGMHSCMNVVTDSVGVAGAVLIRALEPLEGVAAMATLRGGRPFVELCNGPGKLCQAFAITRSQNGMDLESTEIWIEDDGWIPLEITCSTRIGLSAGTDLPLRFFLPDNIFVSKGKTSGG